MVWGAVSFYRQSELVFDDGNLNSERYCSILAAHLLLMAAETFDESSTWIFEKDGESINRSEYNFSWLHDHAVAFLKWLEKCPDFNIIDNVWPVIACRVYSHERQLSSTGKLKQTIPEVW